MAGPLIADHVGESAPMLLEQLRSQGFQFCVEGDRLRIRPAERLTPALLDALARHKATILTLLAPVTDFVCLRGGLTVPRQALELALDLEQRGFRLSLDAARQFQIAPTRSSGAVTDADRGAIARWKWHLAAIVDYECPEVA